MFADPETDPTPQTVIKPSVSPGGLPGALPKPPGSGDFEEVPLDEDQDEGQLSTAYFKVAVSTWGLLSFILSRKPRPGFWSRGSPLPPTQVLTGTSFLLSPAFCRLCFLPQPAGEKGVWSVQTLHQTLYRAASPRPVNATAEG